jgi:hypothetical protein
MEKPHVIDYAFFGVVLIFVYFSFNHSDIQWPAVGGKVFLDFILTGRDIREFYNVNGGAYLLPTYILFAVWSIPVKIYFLITGLPQFSVDGYGSISGIILWWYKLLPTVFYFGTAYIIFKIGLLLNMDRNKSKWISFIWFLFPISTFSNFLFGSWDGISVFFDILIVYFFLKKNLLKASLICMIAITIKPFSVFIFIPLILLFEKNIIKILGYVFIAFFGYLFFNLLYSAPGVLNTTTGFNTGMLNRLYSTGINTQFGVISFFILFFIVSCVISYFTKIDNKDEVYIQKYILYIPLFVYTAFFSFVFFHPQWVMLLTPYLAINLFTNKNIKNLFLVIIGINAGFLLLTIYSSPLVWGNIDAIMLNRGIFPEIFHYLYKETGLTSIFQFVSFGGRLSSTVPYLTFFVSLLFTYLFLVFPSRQNVMAYEDKSISSDFVNRDAIWIHGILIALFVIPSIFMYFKSYTESNYIYDDVKSSPTGYHSGEISNNTIIRQTFMAKYNNLSQILIYLDTIPATDNGGYINFQLFDDKNFLVSDNRVNISNLNEKTYYNFNFRGIQDSKGKYYSLVISPSDMMPENRIGIRKTYHESYKRRLYINDRLQNDNIVMIPGYLYK